MRLVDLDNHKHKYIGYSGSYQAWHIDPKVSLIDESMIKPKKIEYADDSLNVLIAVPTFENILPDTFRSIYRLRDSVYKPSFEFIRGYDCAKARNEIAKIVINQSFD